MTDTKENQTKDHDVPHVHGPNCNHSHYHDHSPYVRVTPKVGANDPCHCGSGKKFKKCCRK